MEIAVKIASAVLISLTVILAPSLSLAEGTGTPDNSGGVAPEARGATGWTGGSRDDDRSGDGGTAGVNTQRDAAAAADQPWMAIV